MKHVELIERIQLVLEGDATPDEVRELERQLAVDAPARVEFEQWQRLFVALGRVPQASPPEGLVAAVTSAADAHLKISRGRDQPLDRHAVIASGVGRKTGSFFGFPGFLSRPRMRLSITQESAHMNISRKVLAGGAVAAVALGVALVMGGLPPKSENVVGTIAPAERYRAPQSGAEAVQLGQPATAQTSTAGADISTAATADKLDAAARADKLDAAAKADKLDAAAKADRLASKLDAGAKADKLDAAAKADKLDAAAKADRVASKLDAAAKADKLDAAAKADKLANKLDAAAKADKLDAAAKANKAGTSN